MRIYTYKLKFDNEWLDISSLINSADTEIKNALCTTAFKSVTNDCSFTLRPSNGLFYAQIVEKILNARTGRQNIEVELSDYKTEEILFSGILDDSSITLTSARIPDSLELSARDYIATLLDKKIKKNIVLENKNVGYIVQRLLNEAGYTSDVVGASSLSEKICKYFVVTDDDDVTYRNIIDTLLYEMPGYVLYRNPKNAKYEIKEIIPKTEPTRTINYIISDKLQTKTEVFDHDGVKLSYPTVSESKERPVFVADVDVSSPAEVPADHYYPENGDVQATYQEYDKNILDRAYNLKETRRQNSDLDILYVKDAKLNIYPGDKWDFPVLSSIDMPSNPVWFPRKAWILLHNKTAETVNLELMNIEGTTVYRSKINNITLPLNASDPEEYDSSYIFDEEHAATFSKWLYGMKTVASTTTTWTEVNLASSLGEKVIISHKDSSVSQAHVVVQIKNTALSNGIRAYKITAVAVSNFSDYEYLKDVRINPPIGKSVFQEYDEYYNSSSNTELKDGAWSKNLTINPDKTLWTRRVIKYTDGSALYSTPTPSGSKGATGEKGDKGDKGDSGSSFATINLYKRASSIPSFDGGSITYVFKTNVIVGDLGSWSKTVPTGNEPLYIISAQAYGSGESDIIDTGEWSVPAILSENGTKGSDGKTVSVVKLYKRASEIPDAPSGTITYSFHGNSVSNADGWILGIPSGTAPVWVISATAVSSDGVSDTISPEEWSIPIIAFQNGSKGDPAPFTRQIYIASKNKPDTPSGTGEHLPDGWSLAIPPRSTGDVIWTSVSPVSVINGKYSYMAWSEPSAVTPDAPATIIVQWKWGSSNTVSPDAETSVVTLGNSILSINGQAVAIPTASGDGWSDTIPEQPAGLDYLWKREWRYANESQNAGWEYYCVSGMQGVEGSYSGIGYVIAGSSITFSGLDKDNKPTLQSMRVPINGEAILFQSASFTLDSSYDRYFLVAYWSTQVGTLSMCHIEPYSSTDSAGTTSYRMRWLDNDRNEIAETSFSKAYVLADIRADGGRIKSVTLTSPTELKAYEKDYFMSIMAQGNMDDINAVAKALDVERVFQRLAAMEAFVDKLFANYVKLYGAIYGGAYLQDGTNPTNGDGFYLNKDGIARIVGLNAKDANLTGSFSCSTFRTVSGKGVSAINISGITANVFNGRVMHDNAVEAAIGYDTNTIFDCNVVINSKTYTKIRSCPRYRTIGWYVIVEESSSQLKIDFRTSSYSGDAYNGCVFGNLGESGYIPISKIGTCTVNGTVIEKGATYCKFSLDSQSSQFSSERTAFTGAISATVFRANDNTTKSYTVNSTSSNRHYVYMNNDALWVENNNGDLIFAGTYFTSMNISISVDTTPGIEVQNILPMSGSFNVGLSSKPFNNGYFSTIHGLHSGNVNGDDSSRTNTSAKVWGAVAN